ncbi:hypothetical protein ACFFX0_12590 [Citricoccus parietis]|uniref:Uncharacterized protein n=1 Tax=Citricoccus parietis TaxID=592307 RepID=A0ABV5FZ86_9MICC
MRHRTPDRFPVHEYRPDPACRRTAGGIHARADRLRLDQRGRQGLRVPGLNRLRVQRRLAHVVGGCSLRAGDRRRRSHRKPRRCRKHCRGRGRGLRGTHPPRAGLSRGDRPLEGGVPGGRSPVHHEPQPDRVHPRG